MKYKHHYINNQQQLFLNRRDVVVDFLSHGTKYYEFIHTPINSFQFLRERNRNLDEAIYERLCSLRNRNKKFNLWYSGGFDSHLILHHMKKFNIWPDEIYNHRTFPTFINSGYYKEFQHARKLLDSYNIPKSTKITYLDMDEDFFNFMANTDVFWDLADRCEYSVITMTAFLNNNYPPFGIDMENETHLLGGIYPTLEIDTEHQWSFNIVDCQINQQKWHPNVENFVADCPVFFNAYVNCIADFFDAHYKNYKSVHNVFNTLAKRGERTHKKFLKIPAFVNTLNEIDLSTQSDKFTTRVFNFKENSWNDVMRHFIESNAEKEFEMNMYFADNRYPFYTTYMGKVLERKREIEAHKKLGWIKSKRFILQ